MRCSYFLGDVKDAVHGPLTAFDPTEKLAVSVQETPRCGVCVCVRVCTRVCKPVFISSLTSVFVSSAIFITFSKCGFLVFFPV